MRTNLHPRAGLRLTVPALVLGGLLGSVSGLQAHVSLENKEAVAGTSFKLVLRVPHGCGGQATTRIRVQVPGVFTSAKPQPKPGWTTEVAARKTVEHTGSAGHDQASAPQEIAWSGRLEEGTYDEFVIWVATGRNQEPTIVHVPVVQECGNAVERWIEVPIAGGKSDDLKSPAPSFKLLRPS
jgi:uncharacterized protein YcnI